MTRRARIVCACAVALGLATAAPGARADATAYRVVPGRTSVTFTILHLGVIPAHGRFTYVVGRIVLDPSAGDGKADFDIASNSVATGFDLRDAFLRSDAMFDSEHHPVVRFRSARLQFANGALAKVDGELTLRGVARPVSLAVSRIQCGALPGSSVEVCEADAATTLRRRDFEMDFAWPIIGDEVELRFHVFATRE